MKRIKWGVALFCFSIGLCLSSAALALETVVLAGDGEYEDILQKANEEFTDYHDMSRVAVDAVLIRKALNESGFSDVKMEFLTSLSFARDVLNVKNGKAVVLAQDAPHINFDDSVYQTDPIIPMRQFEKGIYTIPSNTALLKISSLEELQQFSAVSSHTWEADWATLEKMKLKLLFDTPKYDKRNKTCACAEYENCSRNVTAFYGIQNSS